MGSSLSPEGAKMALQWWWEGQGGRERNRRLAANYYNYPGKTQEQPKEVAEASIQTCLGCSRETATAKSL